MQAIVTDDRGACLSVCQSVCLSVMWFYSTAARDDDDDAMMC